MEQEFSRLEDQDQLKAENDFMKMKLMLEKGAQFGSANNEIEPEIENEFLRNVIEFEKQIEQQRSIRVFEKLGKPDQFIPASEIPDEEIEDAWKKLSAFMYEKGISLGVCSPNVTSRELYRFTIEELFQYEMDDVNVPGIIHGFIYDEFHPDLIYDNTRIATEDCIEYILRKTPLEWMYHFRDENLRLNDKFPLKIEEVKYIINQFKASYSEIDLEEVNDTKCVIDGRDCNVTGKYKLTLHSDGESWQISGSWKVDFELNDLDYWYITGVRVENVGF